MPELPELRAVLDAYKQSFISKEFGGENDDHDLLMDVFAITPELKRGNRQYWGRELGMCWQLLVSRLFEIKTNDWQAGYRDGKDELCDLRSGLDAIDTKYRIGSGDAGTLKKFRSYSKRLKEAGYNPILLILREDNLPAAISQCKEGGWDLKCGDEAFAYIKAKTGVSFDAWLLAQESDFHVDRRQLEQSAGEPGAVS
jgi:hypothetical protein